jgi:outer membrane lipoprotein-sorting protein
MIKIARPVLVALPLLVACGGSSTAPPPAAAPAPGSPPSAAEVFARAKAATGGAAWDGITSSQSEGTIATGGMSGALAMLEDDRTGRTVEHYTIGPIQGADGFDGQHSWSQDPGGEVTVRDAPESLEEARTDVWLTTRGEFQPDFAGAAVSAPREETLAGARYWVIDATPKGGRAIALWFDQATGLVARSVMRRGGKTITSVLDDYRQAGPVRLPFHVAQDATDASGRTDPREHVDVKLSKITANPRLDDATFAIPAMPATAKIDDPSGVTRVPFELVNNHIYADATIDGKPVRMLVDTGGANLLTPASAARLGLKGEGKLAASGVGDEQVDLSLAHAKEVRLGGAVLERPVFYVIDMGDLPATEGVASDGLVGFEMFRRFRVTVDYAAHTLTLADPSKFTPPAGAHVVPFDMAERIPVVTGTLDGLPVRISVDTGSRVSLTMHAPFVHDHDLVARYGAAPETVTGWGVGGPSKARPARLGTLTLGDLAIKDIAGDLATGNKGAFANPDLSANLGGGVLRRFTVSFDYDAHKMYLAPNADFAKPDLYDRSGTWITLDGEALKVVAVAPEGAAEKAGLKVGDRILSIDGASPKSKSVADWRVALREKPAGTRLKLKVSDGSADRSVDLVLSDAIPAHAKIAR